MVVTCLQGTKETSNEAFNETLHSNCMDQGRMVQRTKLELLRRERSSTKENALEPYTTTQAMTTCGTCSVLSLRHNGIIVQWLYQEYNKGHRDEYSYYIE
jgi:hypothetical protein